MVLVKVIGNNLFTGANLRKLEVGSKVEVDRGTAHRWENAGLVEILTDDDQMFEVASPGVDAAEPPEDNSSKKKGK